MSMVKEKPKVYDDGRTKQSFKDETDINRILAKAQSVSTLSHLTKFEGQYGNFAEFDFTEAANKIASANSIFAELPSEVRAEFGQSPAKFFAFANAPENVTKLAQLLPKIAEPGSFFPNVRPLSEKPEVKKDEVVVEPVVPAVAVTPPVVTAPPAAGGADGTG